MPMGIVSDDDFLSEAKNLIIDKLTITAEVVPSPELGRGSVPEVPEVMRGIIGETALVEKGKDVALAFRVSPSAVSAYKNGATSTASYNLPDSGLKERINKSRTRIANNARKKLHLALEQITEEKLQDVGVKDASSIAKDMSAVVKNLERGDEENGPRVQFVFFSPKQKTEEDYEIIHVDN